MKTEKITDKLHFVASSAGLKVESDKDTWINATDEVKKNILENLDKVKKLVGQTVTITLDDNGKYTSISLAGSDDDFTTADEVTIDNGLQDKHIINIQGKQFVTHEGLLEVAHKNGLVSIETEILPPIEDTILFKATVTMKGGKTFVAHGDANDKNVGSMIKAHKIRMCETRAVNRALRFATNIGMCSSDEMMVDEKPSEDKPKEVDMSKEVQ